MFVCCMMVLIFWICWIGSVCVCVGGDRGIVLYFGVWILEGD